VHALGRIIISFRVSLHTAINPLLAPDCRWSGSRRGCQEKTHPAGRPRIPSYPSALLPPPAFALQRTMIHRRAGRTPFDLKRASFAGSRDYRVLLERGIKGIAAVRLLTGNIDGRAEPIRADHRFAQA